MAQLHPTVHLTHSWLALPPARPVQVILLSAVKYHVAHEVWRHTLKPLWLGAAFLNSAYSFYWDVERDWEISWFGQMGEPGGCRMGAPHGGVGVRV